MSAKNIFFLGATGFVGRNLAQRLLAQGHRLVCLARAGQNTSPRARLREVLGQFFPGGSLEKLESTRLEILEGDITKPRLGLDGKTYQRLLKETDEIWHCAALLSFEERHRKEAEKCNIAGTYQALEFARASRVKRFHYLSTAYVAGRRQGLIRESDLSDAHGFKNPYEETKWRAEKLVNDYVLAGPIAATIYRPSIIIGDTKPGTLCSSGVYRVAQIIAAIARKYGVNRNGQGTGARLRIPGSPDCGLNLVSIDYVVDAVSALAPREDAAGRVFHLTNPRPMPNAMVVGAVGDAVGVKLELADTHDVQSEPLTGPEQMLAKAIKVYLPYLQDRMVFEDANTNKVLAGTGIACPSISRERLAGLLFYSQTAAWIKELAEKRPARCLPLAKREMNFPSLAPVSPLFSQV